MLKTVLLGLILIMVIGLTLGACNESADTTNIENRAAEAEQKIIQLQQQVKELEAQIASYAPVVTEVPVEKEVEVVKEVIKEVPVGVSQIEYDSLVAKLEAAEAELRSCEAKLDAVSPPFTHVPPTPTPAQPPTPTPTPTPSPTPASSWVTPVSVVASGFTPSVNWYKGPPELAIDGNDIDLPPGN